MLSSSDFAEDCEVGFMIVFIKRSLNQAVKAHAHTCKEHSHVPDSGSHMSEAAQLAYSLGGRF